MIFVLTHVNKNEEAIHNQLNFILTELPKMENKQEQLEALKKTVNILKQLTYNVTNYHHL